MLACSRRRLAFSSAWSASNLINRIRSAVAIFEEAAAARVIRIDDLDDEMAFVIDGHLQVAKANGLRMRDQMRSAFGDTVAAVKVGRELVEAGH